MNAAQCTSTEDGVRGEILYYCIKSKEEELAILLQEEMPTVET